MQFLIFFIEKSSSRIDDLFYLKKEQNSINSKNNNLRTLIKKIVKFISLIMIKNSSSYIIYFYHSNFKPIVCQLNCKNNFISILFKN